MLKENLRIKENITIADKVAAIESIVSSCFHGGDYTPYYIEIGRVIAIASYFITGYELEGDETIYECATTDPDMRNLVSYFSTVVIDSEEDEDLHKKCLNIIDFVNHYAGKKVRFRREKMIHTNYDLTKILEFVEACADGLENLAKISLMDSNEMKKASEIVKKLSAAGTETDDVAKILTSAASIDFPKETREIIDAKNSKIRELKKKADLYNARNVLSDK